MSQENVSESMGDTNAGEEEVDLELGYRAPAEKTIDDIIKSDEDDEALRKYKATLLGNAVSGSNAVVVDPNDPRTVIVKALALVVEGRPDNVIDLTQNISDIKKTVFTIKEGIQFRIRIDFIVQREIVTGLKYNQKTSRMAVTVDNMSHMVGSYAPKEVPYSYLTPVEDAPQGMTKRGKYHVRSLFTDDDKKEYLKWEWYIEIKKDW